MFEQETCFLSPLNYFIEKSEIDLSFKVRDCRLSHCTCKGVVDWSILNEKISFIG